MTRFEKKIPVWLYEVMLLFTTQWICNLMLCGELFSKENDKLKRKIDRKKTQIRRSITWRIYNQTSDYKSVSQKWLVTAAKSASTELVARMIRRRRSDRASKQNTQKSSWVISSADARNDYLLSRLLLVLEEELNHRQPQKKQRF